MTRLRVECIAIAKNLLASILSLSLLTAPAFGATSTPLGTVVYAEGAHVGSAFASVGATVYGGDRLSTDPAGSVQVRLGSARLLLPSVSVATFTRDEAHPAASLALGSATFSTANSKAFSLYVASAVIRPASDRPTIGRVTLLGPKEFIVKSTRGPLTIAVEDDVREIAEGASYRVVLDPEAAAAEPQGPQGAGAKAMGGPPIKAAKSKFIWYAIAVTGLVTFFAVQEALESPDRP
jgi:hypothetical protein